MPDDVGGRKVIRVLHIEDDLSIVHLLRIALLKSGYEVLEAEGGTVGLEMAYEVLPHAVLLDINMPITDGFRVLEALASHSGSREMPVICLTAITSRDYIDRAYRLGASGYVFKPVDLKILAALLDFHTSRLDLDTRVARLLEEPAFETVLKAVDGNIHSLMEMDIIRYVASSGGKGATPGELGQSLNMDKGDVERSIEELTYRGLLEPCGPEGGVRARSENGGGERMSCIQEVATDERLWTAFVNLVFLGVLD